MGDTTTRPFLGKPLVYANSASKGFHFGLNLTYQIEPARGTTVTGLRNAKLGGLNAAGVLRGMDVIRVDMPHGKLQHHLNINPEYTGLPDPHTPITKGQFNLLRATGNTFNTINRVSTPLAIGTDLWLLGQAVKTDIQEGKNGDNTIVAVTRSAGGWGGAWAGGVGGAEGGAAIGTMIFPGVGTAIGGFLGGIGGAIFGSYWGSKGGEAVGEKIVEMKNN